MNTIKSNNNNLSSAFSDQEASVVNRINDAMEDIQRIRTDDRKAVEQDSVRLLRHELGQALGMDLSSLPQYIVDDLAPILQNMNELRGNPLSFQDIKFRVTADIESAQKQVAERKGVIYKLARLKRKDGTVQAPMVLSDSKLSKLPAAPSYRDIPAVEVLQFAGSEISDDVSGYDGEAKALSALQSPVAPAIIFNKSTSTKRGNQVEKLSAFWDRLGFQSFLAPTGYVVVGIRNGKALKQYVTVSLDTIHLENTRLFNCLVESKDKIVYLDVILNDPSAAQDAVDSTSTKWLTSFDKVLP